VSSIFSLQYGGLFFDILIGLSGFGSYFGAGFVGWRIADKYYFVYEKLFVRRYIRNSVLTFLLLIAVVFSPLSFLGLFWSFIPPFCVLWALNYTKDRAKPPKKSRRKN
jgi:hypothetical protein